MEKKLTIEQLIERYESLRKMQEEDDVLDLDRKAEIESIWPQIRAECRRRNAEIPNEIKEKVDKHIEEKFKCVEGKRGWCHAIWTQKKELFKELGYDWYSPSDLIPDVLWD